jgi:hypothetical protein
MSGKVLEFERPIVELESKIRELKNLSSGSAGAGGSNDMASRRNGITLDLPDRPRPYAWRRPVTNRVRAIAGVPSRTPSKWR